MTNPTYYLLKYIDEAAYCNWEKLFKTKDAAIRAAVETYSSWGWDEDEDTLTNTTSEEKVEMFKKDGVYPKCVEESMGYYYFTIVELQLED